MEHGQDGYRPGILADYLLQRGKELEKQGQFQVTMIYKRPWEDESIDTKVIDVKIVAAGN